MFVIKRTLTAVKYVQVLRGFFTICLYVKINVANLLELSNLCKHGMNSFMYVKINIFSLLVIAKILTEVKFV